MSKKKHYLDLKRISLNLKSNKFLYILTVVILMIISFLLGKMQSLTQTSNNKFQLQISSTPTIFQSPTPTITPIPTYSPYVPRIDYSPNFEDSRLQPSPTQIVIEIKNTKHLGCDSNGRCLFMDGGGPDECSIDRHCKHTECRGTECDLVVGKGDDKCSYETDFANMDLFYSDCAHAECKDFECIAVVGKGNNTCSIDSDCYHYECRDKKCVQVSGKGEWGCSSDYYCENQ